MINNGSILNIPSNVPNALQNVTFSWYDYSLFIIMLALSGLIGIYFGCFGSKQATTNEYLMGGKKMKVIPISISLVASHISGITLLALPADIYRYGAGIWLGILSMVIMTIITIYVYLPVYFNLQVSSTYEYLERRFDNRTRMCASFLFAVSVFVLLPIVTYIPALAFSAATGINVHLITPIVCGVCIFYTTIGGLKAVVWTDTLQFTVTLGAMTAVFNLGLRSAGGLTTVWNKALEGQRLELFDMDWDPTKRETFWAMLFGMTAHWVAHTSINQGCMQKFLSLPSIKDANRASVYYCVGMVAIKTVSVITGLIMFKKYSDCDPLTTKQVKKPDQLLPYYVMDVAGHIPGLPGLFIAGIFCAALSTLSANLNCLAGTVYQDFVSKFFLKDASEQSSSTVLKILVVIIGVISTAMVFVVEHLGGLLALSIGFVAVANGPLLGMFTLGVIFPNANETGAFYGGLSSLVGMSVIVFGTKYYQQLGVLRYSQKPLSTDGCDFIYNSTVPILNSTVPLTKIEPWPIFKLSFYYYTLLGTIITVVVGLLISYFFTNKSKGYVNKELVSPVVHFMMKNKKEHDNIEFYSLNQALEIVK